MSPQGRRIAILSSVHPAFDTRIFQKQARSLAAAGYDVTLVIPHERDETVDGIRIEALPPPGSRARRMLAGPARILRAALRLDADLYHFHDPELIPVGLALKARGRRVIYDVHENVPKSIEGKIYLAPWVRRPIARIAGALEHSASRVFDLVILARDDIADEFQDLGDTLLIRNYPSRAAFPNLPRVDRGDDDFLIAYTGNLTPGRGAREMVQALEFLPQRARARMRIFGKIWPDSLQSELRALPGYAKVEYRGWVPYDSLPPELARADAGIVCFLPEPNHVNAGPTKLFEYMASGLPVVASDFPMWREVLQQNDCGICVDPRDPRAIASALEFLADHPERRREMGENGRRAVHQHYNWEAEADRLLAAYARLLAA
jgi:glycosyltransferase involved in cell wall biosynthesis